MVGIFGDEADNVFVILVPDGGAINLQGKWPKEYRTQF